METEAKFVLPGARPLHKFRDADSLCGYTLGPGRVQRVRDALRQRETLAQVTYTLKGLGGVQGATHRREEIDLALPEALPPVAWPDSPLRARVLALAGQAPLMPLFLLLQRRTQRPIITGDRLIAEMSLDAVRVTAGGQRQSYYELEIELAPAGSEADLSRLVACLEGQHGLASQPTSKFERALALVAYPYSPTSSAAPTCP